jgi:hypothetical protein
MGKDEIVEYSLREAVQKCVKAYGIEGCEDLANRALERMPTFKKRFLNTLYKLYEFGGE